MVYRTLLLRPFKEQLSDEASVVLFGKRKSFENVCRVQAAQLPFQVVCAKIKRFEKVFRVLAAKLQSHVSVLVT